jgi:hypothetical protein
VKARAQGNKDLKAQNYPSIRAALLRFINFLPQKFIQPLVLFQRDSCHIRFEQSQTHTDLPGLILSETGLLRRIQLGKQTKRFFSVGDTVGRKPRQPFGQIVHALDNRTPFKVNC